MDVMTTTVVEELPLIRSKCEGIGNATGTGANVGPATYNLWDSRAVIGNNSRAPFNTTSQRPPLSQCDARVPGPGKYDIVDPADERIGIVSCPFVSESLRFPLDPHDERPGPGAYNLQGKWPHKPTGRSHKFSELPHDSCAASVGCAAKGPGYYSPNYNAASRANPKASHFSKYSSRLAERPNSNPGPGTYNPDAHSRSLYANKPSSMFATNTTRAQQITKDTPGPGDYNLTGSLLKKSPACTLGRSAFGTSAPRFDIAGDRAEAPGPGWYTGEIASRRPHFAGTGNMHPFASTADRFHDDGVSGPGPGAYDGVKPAKHRGFGGETPFGSTVPRFMATAQRFPDLTFDEAFGPANYRRRPMRMTPMRNFVTGPIKPTTGPEQLPERYYNVNYEWPQAPFVRSTLGGASRLTASDRGNGVPGPGSYETGGATIDPNRGGFTWGRDVRFAPAGMEKGGVIGPGRYHHESTLLKKTFNRTIGSDTTWQTQ